MLKISYQKVAEDIIVYSPRKNTKVDSIKLTNVGKVDYASYEKEQG